MTSNCWEGAVYLGLANLAFLSWAVTRQTDKTPGKAALNYAMPAKA